MKRVLLDVNVLLDVLLERSPHASAAAALWAAIERGAGAGLVPAHGFTTVHYLARQARGAKFARRVIEDLLSVFGAAAVDGSVIRGAFALPLPDFEDAVCAASAVAARCDVLATRDPKGFRNAPLPVMDPASALAWLSGPS